MEFWVFFKKSFFSLGKVSVILLSPLLKLTAWLLDKDFSNIKVFSSFLLNPVLTPFFLEQLPLRLSISVKRFVSELRKRFIRLPKFTQLDVDESRDIFDVCEISDFCLLCFSLVHDSLNDTFFITVIYSSPGVSPFVWWQLLVICS
ncbi:hypothetical protein GDO81_021220 [Engystomops pustulosus]|uniref:Uncharacterized protein n=1 Tax=Engystomops pustulosus TaxID=76066 RepID=A0AAV6YZ00_ENGPU|nr:hypothetical protein GDO81_021220 [Engystomops pustulosus]